MDKPDSLDDDAHVKEVISKLKEKIKMQRSIDAIIMKEDEVAGRRADEKQERPLQLAETHKDLEYIKTNWDIQNNDYFISSHRRILGKALVKGRELVHGEVQRYVDPAIWKQKEFNSALARILNEITDSIRTISSQIEDKIAESKADLISQMDDKILESQADLSSQVDGKIAKSQSDLLSQLDGRIAKFQSDLSSQLDGKIAKSQSDLSSQVDGKIAKSQSDLSSQLDGKIAKSQSDLLSQVDDRIAKFQARVSSEIGEQVKNVISTMNNDIENKAWLAEILESRINKEKERNVDEIPESKAVDLNYFVFEERFRGSRDEIKGKQCIFVKYFEGSKNVLDIGCGRGEFLELLGNHGIIGHGIDIDEDMARYCRSRGLNVEKKDAIDYLSQLEDKSLDGVFIDQVVEHLDPEYLIKMIDLCYTKMLFGAYIIIETVNPLSLVSLANFYMDMSHKRPVHPETLKFLLNAARFREPVVQFYAPVPESGRLKQMPIENDLAKEDRRRVELYNYNIERLNSILFGPQDFAVIGKK